MPSEIVISRLIGGGPASTCRRCGRRIFSSSLRSRGCGRRHRTLVARTSTPWLLRTGGGGASPGSMRPREVGCCGRGPPGRADGSARTRTGSRPGYHRLAGTDGSAINRLSGNRRAGRFRNSGARRRGRGRHGRTRLRRASPPDRAAAAPPAGPRAVPQASAPAGCDRRRSDRHARLRTWRVGAAGGAAAAAAFAERPAMAS